MEKKYGNCTRRKSFLILIRLQIIILFLLVLCSAAEEKESKKESNKESTKESNKSTKESEKEETTEEAPEEIQTDKPHVIFIFADDLGWNDVGFTGNSQIPTPNIDALASSSLVLRNYYTEAACTPSRASLLTGKYPIHIGLLNSGIRSGEPTALPLEIKILPEYLKDLDYISHMVGKWNLGYSKKDFTPTFRGFDSFYGFYNEQIDYFDYTSYEKSDDPKVMAFYGIDLQNGVDPIKELRGRYATEVFTEKAVDIIENHDATKPLFLYISHLACHSGNEYMPLQAPIKLINKVGNFTDSKRRTYAAVVNALDESVGKVVDALDRRQFLENSIIVFTSDSGSTSQTASSSWPLRGRQPAAWEGAIRVPAFIWSPFLGLKEPKVAKQLMHVSDWLPTLYAAVGGDVSQLGEIDGVNLWQTFIADSPSPRIEVLHNINLADGVVALRRGDYKLVKGRVLGDYDLWYGMPETNASDPNYVSDRLTALNDSTVQPILQKLNMWLPQTSDFWRMNVVECEAPMSLENGDCDPNEYPCLFNVAADPCEYKNLARRYPRIVQSMLRILNKYNDTVVEPLSNSTDPRADPRCHGFAFVPWLDEEYASDCPTLYNEDSMSLNEDFDTL